MMPIYYWTGLIWLIRLVLPIPDVNYFHAANELYLQGQYAQAENYYRQLFDHKTLGGLAQYNAGNSAYLRKDYQQAYDYYEQALKYLPADKDVWHNLTMARKQVLQATKNQQHGIPQTRPRPNNAQQLKAPRSKADQLLENARAEEYRFKPVLNQQSRKKRQGNFSRDIFNLPAQQLFNYIKDQTQAGYPFKAGSSLQKKIHQDDIIDW